MKRRVLILYGGRSSEHEVSCLSARSVLDVLDRDTYEVVPVGITKEGRWVLTDGDIRSRPGRALPEVEPDGPTVALVLGRKGPALVRFGADDRAVRVASGDDQARVASGDDQARVASGDDTVRVASGDDQRYEVVAPVDVAFPVLHGPYGEDGTVQGLLASVGVPYVGADVTASSVGIDKRAMKNAFKARGLPQGPYLPVRLERWEQERGDLLDVIEGALRYPLFTKPARQGSSIGISKVRDRGGLEDGLREAFEYDRVAIVEEGFTDVREVEVGVLGNSDLQVTRPGEIIPSHEFYDFEAKYLDGSELVVPADLPEAIIERIDDLARQAYLAIGCRGMARIDFFVTDGHDREADVFVNEINTIPGFTPNSMFPRLWDAEGLDYPALVSRLLDLALEAAHAETRYAP